MGSDKKTKSSPTTGACNVQAACCGTMLLHWVDVQKTGGVFGAGLASLLILQNYTLLGLLANLLFYITAICSLWVLVRNVLSAFQHQQGKELQVLEHPFKQLLDKAESLKLSDECANKLGLRLAKSVNCTVKTLAALLFVESWSNSAIFVLVLYFARGILGSFDFLELVIFTWVGLFTLPVTYSLKKKEIDRLLCKVWAPIEPHWQKMENLLARFKTAQASQESKTE